MKKMMKWLGALALIMVCTLTFTACGSDSDGGNGGNDVSLVGTWRLNYDSYNGSEYVTVYDLITFNSNGTGTLIEEVGYGSDRPEPFRWTRSGNTIRITWIEDSDDNVEIITLVEFVDDDTIVISKDGVRVTVYRVK